MERQDDGMEPIRPPGRHRTMRSVAVLACVAVLVLSGCSNESDSDAPAIWAVGAGESVGPDTTTFTAMVRRLGCNNGVTGEVSEPEVTLAGEEVVVTFNVRAIETDASCPDNDEVPYEVVLPEPLGDRRLVDGQCESDSDASSTSFCRSDGVRYDPA